jgi:hypothetical protein
MARARSARQGRIRRGQVCEASSNSVERAECVALREVDVGVDVDVQVPARAACVQWGRFRTRQVGIDRR